MRAPRAAALLAVLVATLTLAGCGVPTSGVIEAGPPASGMPAAQPQSKYIVTLYFLEDGRPKPFVREVASSGALIRDVVGALFEGPTAEESGTASTALPRVSRTPQASLDDGGRTVTVRLPDGVMPLSQTAMLQLTCTLGTLKALRPVPDTSRPGPASPSATGEGADRYMDVRVSADGWTTTQSAGLCPVPQH